MGPSTHGTTSVAASYIHSLQSLQLPVLQTHKLSELWPNSSCCTHSSIHTVHSEQRPSHPGRSQKIIWWEDKTHCADQAWLMGRQVYLPPNSLCMTSLFYPLIFLFSHTCSSPNHLDSSFSPSLVHSLNTPIISHVHFQDAFPLHLTKGLIPIGSNPPLWVLWHWLITPGYWGWGTLTTAMGGSLNRVCLSMSPSVRLLPAIVSLCSSRLAKMSLWWCWWLLRWAWE